MSEGVIEQHLSGLLKNFNKNMYLDYTTKTRKLVEEYGSGGQPTTFRAIKTSDLGGYIAVRFYADFPLYIMLSHPICRFRSHRNYPIGDYIGNLAVIPVFFSSLNTMSVLKLWSDRAEDFFNPANSPLTNNTSAIVCWELPVSSKPVEYSSMNFLLQNGSNPEPADNQLAEIFEQYFRLAYWSFPRMGFSPGTHFLHGRTSISAQVKVWKSLFVLDSIVEGGELLIENKSYQGTWLWLKGLTCKENGEFIFKPVKAMVDTEAARTLLPREDLSVIFVNGVIAEIKQRHGRNCLMTVIASIGESYFDILTSLLGLVADAKFQNSESLSDIGSQDYIKERVSTLYRDMYHVLEVKRTVSDAIANAYELAIHSMYPMLISSEGRVRFVHPLVWSLLKKLRLLRAKQDEQIEILNHLLKLLDLTNDQNFMKIFLDESADYLARKGVEKKLLVHSLFSLARDIRFSRTYRRILDSRSWQADGPGM